MEGSSPAAEKYPPEQKLFNQSINQFTFLGWRGHPQLPRDMLLSSIVQSINQSIDLFTCLGWRDRPQLLRVILLSMLVLSTS